MKKLLTSFLLALFVSCQVFGQSTGNLTVSVKTSSTGGKYSPKHVMAIWIEDASGKFVKTLLEYGSRRRSYLNTWEASTRAAGSSFNTVDAISGATQRTHTTRTCTWDGTNYKGALVADGTYKLRMELTDKNNTGNRASFEFVKGQDPVNLSPSNVASFSNVHVAWAANGSTNVEKVGMETKLKLLPNPSTGIFKLNTDEALEVTVVDLSGHTVFKQKTSVINLMDQPAGVYIYQIKKNHQIVRGQLIKE